MAEELIPPPFVYSDRLAELFYNIYAGGIPFKRRANFPHNPPQASGNVGTRREKVERKWIFAE